MAFSQDTATISCCLAVSLALNSELGDAAQKNLFTIFRCDSLKRKNPWLVQRERTLMTPSIHLGTFMTKFLFLFLYFRNIY